jgi:hypothetical protein
MRNSRALGQALVAAVACAADDPPPPAGDRHGLVPAAYVAGRLVRPTEIRDRWMSRAELTTVIGGVLMITETRVGWRGTGAKSRDTIPLIQIGLGAAGLDRVRASAMEVQRDQHQRRPSAYGNTPPAERAPPATID